jgi:hypothetical protein
LRFDFKGWLDAVGNLELPTAARGRLQDVMHTALIEEAVEAKYQKLLADLI